MIDNLHTPSIIKDPTTNQILPIADQLEVSTSLLCHSTQIQNCGNSRFPHHTLHEYKHNHNKEQESRNSQLCNTSRRWNAGQLEVSTSLLCHSTQIQNCSNSRFAHHNLHEYKYNHNKEQESRNSQLSNTSRRWNAGQLEVSTSLLCHSTQIQNCGNSRFPHHTLHE